MSLRDLDLESHLRDPAKKQRYVTTLFDTIAPTYDRFTRWFSFGMDAGWKRELARWAVEVMPAGGILLDLACGSGDVGRAVERYGGKGGRDGRDGQDGQDGRGGPSIRVIGIDPSAEMLRLALRRQGGRAAGRQEAASTHYRHTALPPYRLLRADMMAIPLPDVSVDVVTVAYGFRNTPDSRGALVEAARVLRPGGWLFSLDFYRPKRRPWGALYLGYLRVAGAAYGWLWHREPDAYGYIAKSLEGWMTAPDFERALEAVGFRVARAGRKLGGGICLHGARLVDGPTHRERATADLIER
jgi:demethylmenaquinone methyltransferase/2-methoxy-6-polyprenyl-1,4-benzoquinol methylase